MYRPPRPRRLRRGERARRRRFLASVIVFVALMVISLGWFSRSPGATAPPAEAVPDALVAITTEPVEGVVETAVEPVVYPYSIIPGGAASADALRQAMSADPVVRAHYANFDIERTRVVRLTEARVAHVSYRIGDDVFWTKRPLLLKAGETLLTDGEHYARTRCGNQLAASPGPVSVAEPSADLFDFPLKRSSAVVQWPALAGVLAMSGGALTTADGSPDPVFAGAGTPFPIPGLPLGDPRGPGRGRSDPTSSVSGSLPADGSLLPPVIQVSLPPGVPPPFGNPPPGGGDPASPGNPHIVTGDPPPPPGGGSTKTVPEPGTFLLIGTGGLAWLRRRIRRRSGKVRTGALPRKAGAPVRRQLAERA